MKTALESMKQIREFMNEQTTFAWGKNGRIVKVKAQLAWIQNELKKAGIPVSVKRKPKHDFQFDELSIVRPIREKKGQRIENMRKAEFFYMAAIDSFEKKDTTTFERELSIGVVFLQEAEIADLKAKYRQYNGFDKKRKEGLKVSSPKKLRETEIIRKIRDGMRGENPSVGNKEIANEVLRRGDVKLAFKTILNVLSQLK